MSQINLELKPKAVSTQEVSYFERIRMSKRDRCCILLSWGQKRLAVPDHFDYKYLVKMLKTGWCCFFFNLKCIL